MREQTISLPQATLIAEHTGLAGTLLTRSGEVSGGGGSGGAFSVYYSFTELKDVEIVVTVMSATYKALRVDGIPKGKRNPRRFPSVATERHAPRSLVFRGWGFPAPPNPPKLGRRDDSEPDQIGFHLSSADWNRERERLFEEYVAFLSGAVVIDFPWGIGCECQDAKPGAAADRGRM